MNSDLAIASIDRLKSDLAAYTPLLESYVRKHLPPRLWAAFDPLDVVHDVYFEALRRSAQLQQIDIQTRPRWLLTIARNRIKYLLRRHSVARRDDPVARTDEESELAMASLLEELAVYERTPSASAASHEAHEAVRQSICRLSGAHAAALQSRYFDGLTPQMIAEQTGTTENNVRQVCHRALKALRTELAKPWVRIGANS